MHFRHRPPQTHISSWASFGQPSPTCPHSHLYPAPLCAELACADTSVGLQFSSFSWVWPMERGEARSEQSQGICSPSPPEGSPQTGSVLNQSSQYPSTQGQVPLSTHLCPSRFHTCSIPLPVGPRGGARASLSLALGSCTIPCVSYTARFAL